MSGTVKRHILFLSLLLPAFIAPAKDDDYSWWNSRHGWDGYSSWTKYLTYSAACFGPNALPVPEIRDALIGSRASLEARADLHFSRGDDTQNLFMKFRYPFLDGRVAVEAYGVPIEHYVLDTVTRDERAARSRDPRGPSSSCCATMQPGPTCCWVSASVPPAAGGWAMHAIPMPRGIISTFLRGRASRRERS